MSRESRLTPHKPSHYIAGVYIHQTKVWVGEFEATTEELIGYGIDAGLSDPESILVSDMIHAQATYEEWWDRVRFETYWK